MEAEGHEASPGPTAGEDAWAAWERACIARTRAGDTGAFGKLVERYSARIYTHLVRLVGQREEAEDLTQETFIRAFRFLGQYDASHPFRNWVYTIATNVGLNALRTKRRRLATLSLDALDRDGTPGAGPLDRQADGRQRVARGELASQVAAAVKRLPPRSAALVDLHYREGLSIREAAAVLGLSEGAAKVALCRARRRLREWLVEDIEQ